MASGQRQQTEIEQDSAQLRVQRVDAGRKHGPVVVVAVIAGLIAVALWKPWDGGPPFRPIAQLPSAVATATSTPRVAARSPVEDVATVPTATPQATLDPVLAAVLHRRDCQSGEGWRLVSWERDAGQDSRTLWDITAMSATADGALSRPYRVWSEHVVAIGFCPPGATPTIRAENATSVTLFRELDDGDPQHVADARFADPALAAVGEVYLSPPAALSDTGGWPEGRYLFRVDPAPDFSGGWFAVQVIVSNDG
jgi:hypothetical protein